MSGTYQGQRRRKPWARTTGKRARFRASASSVENSGGGVCSASARASERPWSERVDELRWERLRPRRRAQPPRRWLHGVQHEPRRAQGRRRSSTRCPRGRQRARLLQRPAKRRLGDHHQRVERAAGDLGDEQRPLDGPRVGVRDLRQPTPQRLAHRGVFGVGHADDARAHRGAVAGRVHPGVTEPERQPKTGAQRGDAQAPGEAEEPAQQRAAKGPLHRVEVSAVPREGLGDERRLFGVVGDEAPPAQEPVAIGRPEAPGDGPGGEPLCRQAQRVTHGHTEEGPLRPLPGRQRHGPSSRKKCLAPAGSMGTSSSLNSSGFEEKVSGTYDRRSSTNGRVAGAASARW